MKKVAVTVAVLALGLAACNKASRQQRRRTRQRSRMPPSTTSTRRPRRDRRCRQRAERRRQRRRERRQCRRQRSATPRTTRPRTTVSFALSAIRICEGPPLPAALFLCSAQVVLGASEDPLAPVSLILLLGACRDAAPPAPTAEQSAQLNEAENMLNGSPPMKKGRQQRPGPSNSSD